MTATIRTIGHKGKYVPVFRFDQNRNALRAVDAVRAAARALWPSKASAELAARTGASARTCEYWLGGHVNLSADALANLIRSDAGLEILSALLGEARPHWWASFKRKVRIERLSEQLEALRIEQEAIQQERIDAQNMHR